MVYFCDSRALSEYNFFFLRERERERERGAAGMVRAGQLGFFSLKK